MQMLCLQSLIICISDTTMWLVKFFSAMLFLNNWTRFYNLCGLQKISVLHVFPHIFSTFFSQSCTILKNSFTEIITLSLIKTMLCFLSQFGTLQLTITSSIFLKLWQNFVEAASFYSSFNTKKLLKSDRSEFFIVYFFIVHISIKGTFFSKK